MFTAFLKGINTKRLMVTMVVMFAYIWVSDFAIHGMLLANLYKETASLWRPEQEMSTFFVWMLLGQLMIAKYFTYIFVRGYEGKGTSEGIRFGLVMGLFSIAGNFILYAVLPLPTSVLWSWVSLGLLQSLGGGILASLVYKK